MTPAGLIARNLRRNLVRTSLTAAAITFAMALVVLLMTMPAGLELILTEGTSNTRLTVHNKAGLVYSLPYSFVNKVRSIDGVEAVVGTSWFGGTYEDEDRVSFPNFAVEAEHVGAVYPDYPISQDHLQDFVRYRDGALVGQQVAERYGIEVGDRFELRSTVWPITLDLRVVGMIADPAVPFVWLNRKYLDQELRKTTPAGLDSTGNIWVRVGSPEFVQPVMSEIAQMSRNSGYEAASETEESFFRHFFGSLQMLVRVILGIAALAVLCILLIAMNSASLSIRERGREIAVLRSIGFGRATVFRWLVAESVVLCGVAGAVGVFAAVGLTASIRTAASGSELLGPLASFVFEPELAVAGVGVSLALGVMAAAVPAWSATGDNIADALRRMF